MKVCETGKFLGKWENFLKGGDRLTYFLRLKFRIAKICKIVRFLFLSIYSAKNPLQVPKNQLIFNHKIVMVKKSFNH